MIQYQDLPYEVQEIGKLHLEGHVIPHSWYEKIRFESGKVDLASITLLSEIIYWYRPTYEKDEITGAVVGVHKKFRGDALQKSKQALADRFGLTERQVKDALVRLEEMGLIKREYRTVRSQDGHPIPNVLFIKIIPEKITELTFGGSHLSDVQTSDPRRSNVRPPTPERHTYTEITTKTTTKKKEREADASALSLVCSNCSENSEEELTFGSLKNVRLTSTKYKQLLEHMSETERDSWIEEIDLAIEKQGKKAFEKKYKSHYATILSWKKLREKNSPNSAIAHHRKNSKLAFETELSGWTPKYINKDES